MAKPQLEDGHTRIANEILEQLVKTHLSSNQWQVLICIIRKTYGYQKKVDYIANSQICDATGLGKSVVSRVLRSLEDMQLISRQSKYIGFKKDWERWQGLKEIVPVEPREEPAMRIVRSDGYIGIWHRAIEPEYQSMASKHGYALEHRLVVARKLKRCLESWEVVHHKGTQYPLGSLDDKADNREDNLELLPSQAAHLPSILAQQRIKELEAKLAELIPLVDNEKLAKSVSTVAIQSTKVSSPHVTQKKKEILQKKPIYIAYLEFKNVRLSLDEHQKLIAKFGEGGTKDRVENLSLYIASKGDKYKSHYATILSWEKRNGKEVSRGTHRGDNKTRQLPKAGEYKSPAQFFRDRESRPGDN